MKINKTIELENGAVQFTGELSSEELSLVIEAGLAILLRMGVIGSVAQATAEDNDTPDSPVVLN